MADLDELRREIVLAVSQSKSPREFLRDDDLGNCMSKSSHCLQLSVARSASRLTS